MRERRYRLTTSAKPCDAAGSRDPMGCRRGSSRAPGGVPHRATDRLFRQWCYRADLTGPASAVSSVGTWQSWHRLREPTDPVERNGAARRSSSPCHRRVETPKMESDEDLLQAMDMPRSPAPAAGIIGWSLAQHSRTLPFRWQNRISRAGGRPSDHRKPPTNHRPEMANELVTASTTPPDAAVTVVTHADARLCRRSGRIAVVLVLAAGWRSMLLGTAADGRRYGPPGRQRHRQRRPAGTAAEHAVNSRVDERRRQADPGWRGKAAASLPAPVLPLFSATFQIRGWLLTVQNNRVELPHCAAHRADRRCRALAQWVRSTQQLRCQRCACEDITLLLAAIAANWCTCRQGLVRPSIVPGELSAAAADEVTPTHPPIGQP